MKIDSTQTFVMEHVSEIDSTSSELLRRAQLRSVHATALSADVQTAGRGQRGRRWFAEAGDALLMSVGWTFPAGARLDGLSLAVGVCVAQTIGAFSRGRVTLKWPNDVLIDDAAKVAGVLVETVPAEHGARTAVIGIGVNVRAPHPTNVSAFERDALPPASLVSSVLPRSADGASIVCAAVRSALLQALAEHLPRFEREGFAAFREEWLSRAAYAGRNVRVFESASDTQTSFTGRIVNVAEDGALLIDDGRSLHTLRSGAVSIRPA